MDTFIKYTHWSARVFFISMPQYLNLFWGRIKRFIYLITWLHTTDHNVIFTICVVYCHGKSWWRHTINGNKIYMQSVGKMKQLLNYENASHNGCAIHTYVHVICIHFIYSILTGSNSLIIFALPSMFWLQSTCWKWQKNCHFSHLVLACTTRCTNIQKQKIDRIFQCIEWNYTKNSCTKCHRCDLYRSYRRFDITDICSIQTTT